MPSIRFLLWLYSLLFVLCIFLGQSSAQLDRIVIECGGFVRWNPVFTGSAHIGYNKIKVNLIAQSSGTLKEVTEILPNGAFSVPVYDLNVYRLVLSSPKGWMITPIAGHVIDLQADPKTCSKDFDFILNGFSVYGQVVTYGLNHGPPGLSVRLVASKPVQIVQSNTTERDGHFQLGPVLPGTYELMVSERDDNEANHVRAHVTVTVDVDSVALNQPVMLMGHFIRGTVLGFDHRAFGGTLVYLGTKVSIEELSTVQCERVDNLPKAAAAAISVKLGSDTRLFCQTRTNSEGSFSFDSLPGGAYVLLPHYITPAAGHVLFDPPVLPVTMAHKDIYLGNSTFLARRIQISPGQVLWPDGRPIESARVYTNNDRSHSVLTDRDGFYQLGFLEPGEILIRVEADRALFHPNKWRLTADSNRLPEIRPHRLSVCGRIELSDDFDRTIKPRVVMHDNQTGERLPDVTDVEPAGSRGWRFCTDLAPGVYTFTPDLSTANPTTHGIHVVPATIQVHVQSGPVSDLVFSQFRAKLSGRLRCLDSQVCVPVSGESDRFPFLVRLRVSEDSDVVLMSSPVRASEAGKHTGHFVLDHVLPGDYVLDLMYNPDASTPPEPVDGWCWKPSRVSDTANLSLILGSTRRVRVQQADLSWAHEPALDFAPVGHAIRIQLDAPFRFDRWTEPLITLRASAPNHTELAWQLDGLHQTKLCLPALPNALAYQLSATSPCVELSPLEPANLSPLGHPRIVRNPVLKLSVRRVPIYVRFQFDQASPVPSELSSVTGDGPILVDVGFPGSDRSTETVMANWSHPTKSQPPFAEAPVWLEPNQTITLHARPAPRKSDQWHYTYVLRESGPVHVTAPMVTDPYSSVSASMQPSSPNACDLFSGQTVLFDLDVGLVLRGQIQPPVDKVDVALFMQSPHTDGGSDLVDRQPIVGLLLPQTDSRVTEASTGVPLAETVVQTVEPLATTRSNSFGVFTFSDPVRVPQTLIDFGRVKPKELFTVRLAKPGFDFTEQDVKVSDRAGGNTWLFKATKLSLVEVVIYEAVATVGRTPLEGVLVSIIGEGHRGNLFTDQSGLANFVGLAPGQYYVRAMMKEYTFRVRLPNKSASEPTDQPQPINVQPGVAVHVEIVATRVAYSASGLVRSLGGTPLASVTVEAKWIPAPPAGAKLMGNASLDSSSCESVTEHIPHEQSTTDADGRFRIRGLLPGCYYAISVLSTQLDNLGTSLPCQAATRSPASTPPSVHHAIPAVSYLRQPRQDFDGLAFIAIPLLFLSTFTVDVDTDPQFMPHLRLTLFPLDRPDLVLMRHEFADSLLFTVPGSKMCPMIGREIVTRLENTLDPQMFHNVGPQQVVLRPQLDVSKHHTFTFRPKLRLAPLHTFRSDL